MRRTTTTMLAALCCGLVLAGTAAASYGNGGVTPQTSGSPNAQGISSDYLLIGAITGFVFVLVEGLLVAFVLRYRRRGRARTVEGPQVHGSTRLELAWTILPALGLAAIAAYTFSLLPGIQNVPAATGSSPRTEITVEGHQFYWLFRYPNGAVSIDRLIAPVDRTVKLTVIAPNDDVNHSWWIPELGGKIDAIPGRVNHTWFRAPRVGTYVGQCAEFCGAQHALMTAEVDVVPQSEFDRRTATLLAQLNSGDRQLGLQEFGGVCEKCHRLTGPRYIGPTLGGNPLLADRKALADLVRHGRRLMPAVGNDWSDKQIDALVAYTKTLGGAG